MRKYKNNRRHLTKTTSVLLVLFGALLLSIGIGGPQKVFADCSAADNNAALKVSTTDPGAGQYCCGSGDDAVQVSINFGCTGKGSALTDMAFAITRILSAGVGLVVIGSIVVAGIQYTTSRGDPSATAKAIGRIRSSITALIIYIFAAAMLNFVLPTGFFK